VGPQPGLDRVVRSMLWNPFWVMASFENVMRANEKSTSLCVKTHNTHIHTQKNSINSALSVKKPRKLTQGLRLRISGLD
jgi:hypothetical protein